MTIKRVGAGSRLVLGVGHIMKGCRHRLEMKYVRLAGHSRDPLVYTLVTAKPILGNRDGLGNP